MPRRHSKKEILAIIVLLLLTPVLVFYIIWNRPTHRSIEGIREPVQIKAEGHEHLTYQNYDIEMEYLYSYDIEGLAVRSTPYIGIGVYYFLSPMDVALAWGQVAEYNDRIDFNWTQNNRWASFEVESAKTLEPVGGVKGALSQFSNNHLISRDPEIRKKLWKIRAGDHIRIKGYLVDVDCIKKDGSGGSKWHGSTVRDDYGAHACEVILVKDIEWLD